MTDTATTSASRETLGFQAEVKQLLHLMIHSLYSNREIFLRELISNASDACDKLRFEALDNPALFENDSELAIRVDYDPAARTLTVTDNGVGMSRDEVIANLGTIAKSGTREFFSQLTGDQQKDAHLIGQFGVGFYSSFIVADKVTVHTRRAGETAGAGRALGVRRRRRVRRRAGREARRAAPRSRCTCAKARTTFLSGREAPLDHPQVFRSHRPADPDEEGGVEGRQAGEDGPRTRRSTRRPRCGRARRARSPTSSTRSSTSTSATISTIRWRGRHARVEGRQEYTQLLYVPAHAPFDLWDRDARHGIKLYVRRVFIMDDAEQLLPAYLRFVRGVVDSNDLPLNVSREILQESQDIEAIRGGCTRKVLDLLARPRGERQGEVREVLGRVRQAC